MSRVFFIKDSRGDRQFDESRLPVTLGGARVADIVIPGVSDEAVIARIAIADGHAFIQPEHGDIPLFHNHERLQESVWLKSGDQVEHDQALLSWTVRGDQVQIRVSQQTHDLASESALVPPAVPPARDEPLPVTEAEPASAEHRRLKQGVTVLFLLLVLLAAFVLLATPVEIQITPEPDEYAVSGFPPMVSVGESVLAWPGSYRITADHAGYFPLDEPLIVDSGDFQEFSFSMRERPGKIALLVTPDVPFELLVDGEPVAVNAQSVAEIERGEHRLGVQTDWYLPVEVEIDVKGLGQLQQLELGLTPAWAEVRILSQPEGAQVHNEDELLGVTPLDTRLLQGVQVLTLEKPLFKTATLETEIIAGQPVVLEGIVLLPADGQLVLESAPDAATVQVDGRYQGTTPVTLALSSGTEHRLQLSKPGYTDWKKTVSLDPGQQLTLDAELQPAYGTLFITVEPADAQLRVDGKAQGKAMRRLRLTTREHRLEIYRQGYETRVLKVTPDAVNSRSIDFVLKTTRQARIEATPLTIRAPAGQVLRLVRPGESFTMGASRREAGRRSNESARLVQLVRPFYFGEKEVTNAEYRQFRSGHVTGQADGASLNGDQQPVAGISRDDAARYCNWLSRKQGYPEAYREQNGSMQLVTPVNTGYRLPSEAEWAYVARVLGRSEISRYPWSGKYPPSAVVGNFADVRISDTLAETVPGYDDRYRGSAPVGSFAAFPEGFYDLGGNVAEWMNDYYAVYPGESGQLVEEPFGPEKGKHYVVRGSSWRHGNITELRLSYRDYSRVARSDIGFRLARYAN